MNPSLFHRPQRNGEQVAYFCGHSLGLQPLNAAHYVVRELERWGELGVDGHFLGDDPWLTFHESLAQPLAHICGAQMREVSIQNTLSVNIHLMLGSFYQPAGKKRKILMEAPAFPSDHYAVKGHLEVRGMDPVADIILIHPDPVTMLIDHSELLGLIHTHAEELALVYLGGVQYISGQVLDMETVSAHCNRLGVLCGWDLAHAIGNVALHLHEWSVDFAVFCCYKYLNSGPGSLGGLFVHQKHLEGAPLPRFAGWWGHNKATRFKMGPVFDPIPTADGWALSNPPALSMAAMKASLPMFEQATMPALLELGKGLNMLLRAACELDSEMSIVTPPYGLGGGNMLTVRHPQARMLFEHLQSRNIVGDWREPGIIRLAVCPLYTAPEELSILAEAIRDFAGATE
jgi:kynureninase